MPVDMAYLMTKVSVRARAVLPLLMVNQYEGYQGIGIHSDHADYGETVAVVSCGGPAILTFVVNGTEVDIKLPPRSMFVFYGELRSCAHFIRSRYSMLPRTSYTFRSLGK